MKHIYFHFDAGKLYNKGQKWQRSYHSSEEKELQFGSIQIQEPIFDNSRIKWEGNWLNSTVFIVSYTKALCLNS